MTKPAIRGILNKPPVKSARRFFPFSFLFFEELKQRLGEWRSHVAWLAPRGSPIRGTIARATAPNTYWGSTNSPMPRLVGYVGRANKRQLRSARYAACA